MVSPWGWATIFIGFCDHSTGDCRLGDGAVWAFDVGVDGDWVFWVVCFWVGKGVNPAGGQQAGPNGSVGVVGCVAWLKAGGGVWCVRCVGDVGACVVLHSVCIAFAIGYGGRGVEGCGLGICQYSIGDVGLGIEGHIGGQGRIWQGRLAAWIVGGIKFWVALVVGGIGFGSFGAHGFEFGFVPFGGGGMECLVVEVAMEG